MDNIFNKISIDNSNFMHTDVVVIDRYRNRELIYASIVANDLLTKNVVTCLKKKCNYTLQGLASGTCVGQYDDFKQKEEQSDFSHLIIKKQDCKEELSNDDEQYTFYIFYRNRAELEEILYDKLYTNTPIPIQREWMEELINIFNRNGDMDELSIMSKRDKKPFECCKFCFNKSYLQDLIQANIRNHTLSIGNSHTNSDIMGEVNGLDMYLNNFGDLLANKIQEAFVPKFNPKEDTYTEEVNNYDDSCFYGGINIYEAQKATIQSCVNNLNKNKTTFVIGEMGVGNLMCV